MITKDNLKDVIQTIPFEDVLNAIDADGDYLLIVLHTFNAGSFGTIESVDFDEDEQTKHIGDGNLYVDKDQFGVLADELELFEY